MNRKTKCHWKFDDKEGHFETSCGYAFSFEGAWPRGFDYCPYCGKWIYGRIKSELDEENRLKDGEQKAIDKAVEKMKQFPDNGKE